MKKLASFFVAARMYISATSCESLYFGKEKNMRDMVNVTFEVQTPQTRSQTDTDGNDSYVSSTDGTEAGTDAENNINNVQLIFADQDGNYITDAEISSTVGTRGQYVVAFKSEDLEKKAGKTVKVYLQCNTPKVTVDGGANTPSNINFLDATFDATSTEIYAKANAFYMTNAQAVSFNIPSDLKPYTSETTPLDLGIIVVERAAARFDIGPASTESKTYNTSVGGYKVVDGLYIKLTDIAMVNISRDQYYYRRVSADGSNNNEVISGVEMPNNYVVDVDWATKRAYNGSNTPGDFVAGTTYEEFRTSMSNSKWWTSLSSLNQDDSYDGSYKIWRYTSENTLPAVAGTPATPVTATMNNSTGVVFRGKLVVTDALTDTDLKNGLSSPQTYGTIYAYDNVILGNWARVKALAETAGNEDKAFSIAYKAAVALGGDGEANAKDCGFVPYTPNSNGYEMVYLYWNRHNDNKDNTENGVMEFATVRNNVYKLAVDEITKLGYPFNGDTPPGDTKVEQEEVFFKVRVKVLPWVVRKNAIEF